ncbi:MULTISPECIES: hypothetical protein [unclassified Sulfurimonas]|nr:MULTISPECIES: hypothetical protein [unclassified Sulfurimonas]
MRLTKYEVEFIKKAFIETFEDGAIFTEKLHECNQHKKRLRLAKKT